MTDINGDLTPTTSHLTTVQADTVGILSRFGASSADFISWCLSGLDYQVSDIDQAISDLVSLGMVVALANGDPYFDGNSFQAWFDLV